MEISLNVSEDMSMTLNRYDKSKKGQNPGPFLTSFLRDDNPHYNNNAFLNGMIKVDTNDYAKKYNTIENTKKYNINNLAKKLQYQNPQEQIKKLGFGDTITTKYNFGEQSSLNINNSNNSFNGLFGQMDQSNVMNTSKEMGNAHFFTTMSNSNLNLTQNSINSNGNGEQSMLQYSSQFPNNKINLNDSKIHIVGDVIKDNYNNYVYSSDILNKKNFPTNNFNNFGLNQGNNNNNNFYNSHMIPSFHMNLNKGINQNNNIYKTTIIK